MKIFGKWMLGAALAAATLGLGATNAQAARIHVVVGAPVAYVPACPGPGYVWVAGYYDGYGAWVPGFWNFVGVGVRPVVRFGGPVYDRHFEARHFDHGFYRGRR